MSVCTLAEKTSFSQRHKILRGRISRIANSNSWPSIRSAYWHNQCPFSCLGKITNIKAGVEQYRQKAPCVEAIASKYRQRTSLSQGRNFIPHSVRARSLSMLMYVIKLVIIGCRPMSNFPLSQLNVYCIPFVKSSCCFDFPISLVIYPYAIEEILPVSAFVFGNGALNYPITITYVSSQNVKSSIKPKIWSGSLSRLCVPQHP
ncbi:hypothetical protein FF38_06225 [Lucilia cuprina]|uniref:Uncharacterized protein n=1 Tax=Lucilia cuprina TaxID=7375 RepID=A0A0L0CGN5_LUCCU|nr:hypothetical protein FF38_06225 [Lucilia cuprina]